MSEDLDFDPEEFIEQGQRVFEWNEHGVCLNSKLMTFKCIGKFMAQIHWARNDNNRWVYGVSFDGYNQGWGEPVLNHSHGYDTEDEAYYSGVERLVYLIGNNNDLRKYDNILRMLKDELPNDEPTNQLTLF